MLGVVKVRRFWLTGLLVLAGCGSDPGAAGALVWVSMPGRVGVVLDDIPVDMRNRVATAMLAKDAAFWRARATEQIHLTEYRLIYRHFVYPDQGKRQLPLPDSQVWNVALDAAGASRTTIDGHDVVAIHYELNTLLVSDKASPAISDPALATIGGTWSEPFVLPVDPEMLLQRTGYACADEVDFPPRSVDSENIGSFYDQDCQAEQAGSYLCHTAQTSPAESCTAALTRAVGKVQTAMKFTRVAYSAELASLARVGAVTHADTPDLAVRAPGLDNHRISYRYVPQGDCAVFEGCVSGTGWRRLLQFDAAVHNVGGKPLHIGPIDYYLTGDTTLNDQHHVFEYSACHQHYHFNHYGDFTFGTGGEELGAKKAFCLLSSERYSNNESTPLNTDYASCTYQGIEAGWGDVYMAGIDCQWIDVTGISTAAGPVTGDLAFSSNPDRFLCEGQRVLDATGDPLWEPTSFTTQAGEPVDRMQCSFPADWDANNLGAKPVTIPQSGGFVTSACSRGELGPLRNCGFSEGAVATCTPGATVSLQCSVDNTSRPQVVRVCEASLALGTGVACTYNDAATNAVVGATRSLSFTCPGPRGADEPGGRYSLYTAPVFTPDGAQAVTCTQL